MGRGRRQCGARPAADGQTAVAIQALPLRVAAGEFDAHFPIDVFQTGSGTSSNMNANEVIATAGHPANSARRCTRTIDVNMGQSSNDVIPTAVHVSAALLIVEDLLPALEHLKQTLDDKAAANRDVDQDRPHAPDGCDAGQPGQEIGGWAAQMRCQQSIDRIESVMPRLCRLAQGGTAVGTGINAHPNFGAKVAVLLAEQTGSSFAPAAIISRR